jgi:hypothetical protein
MTGISEIGVHIVFFHPKFSQKYGQLEWFLLRFGSIHIPIMMELIPILTGLSSVHQLQSHKLNSPSWKLISIYVYCLGLAMTCVKMLRIFAAVPGLFLVQALNLIPDQPPVPCQHLNRERETSHVF